MNTKYLNTGILLLLLTSLGFSVNYISSCNITISSSGYYVLTQDLTVSNSFQRYCIYINASDVTVDCQHHTINSIVSPDPGVLSYGIVARGHKNISIVNCSVKGFSIGIFFFKIHNGTISHNSITIRQYDGIGITDSNNILISNNDIYMNYDARSGIGLYNSSYNTITYNNIHSNIFNTDADGIRLSSNSSHNTISYNRIHHKGSTGIGFFSSSYNSIYSNLIYAEPVGGFLETGIYFYTGSEENIIYDNCFSPSLWDVGGGYTLSISILNTTLNCSRPNIIGGSCTGGNYWAKPDGTGYSQTCTDSDNDGICDSPYTIDSNNIDYLPLAGDVSCSSLPLNSGDNGGGGGGGNNQNCTPIQDCAWKWKCLDEYYGICIWLSYEPVTDMIC